MFLSPLIGQLKGYNGVNSRIKPKPNGNDEIGRGQRFFISADCWLCVFELLTPSQLGFEIAMISHRFDFYVDEHFKTRKRTLKFIQIRSKIGENGTNGMEIVEHYDGKALPIPQVQLPRKFIGFKHIHISFIDRNAIAFLFHFRQFFASGLINLAINTHKDRIAGFLLRNIWPMFGKNLHGMGLSGTFFRHLRQFVGTSILNDFPSLRFVSLYTVNLFGEFPCDDNAAASDGQAVTKWLFTPLQNDVPKMLKCWVNDEGNWMSRIEAIKAAFTYASSPVNFIVVIYIGMPFADSVVLFNLTNELTREQLALKRSDDYDEYFLLIRRPIVRTESKWAKWEEEAIGWRFYEPSNQWNQIFIQIINEDEIGDELLDATLGPSDH
ncbi:hypothetical protein niasHT_035921 [Heterodera trifolii]|uniref:Uncharacterized protein n=1 Tax=Heterodera trifolii TaxID=157864 RepID=A0ABD2IGG8_9BILA